MSEVSLPNVQSADFCASATGEAGQLTATLSGNADLRSKDALQTFLGALHAEALRLKVANVAVDFRELQFMNSSCFKNFVTWIVVDQELAAADQYKITFLSNPTKHWQRRSLQALSCFASELVSVEA